MNKFRNEMEVKLAGEVLLLRATFENLQAIESSVGSLPFLANKFLSGVAGGKGSIEEKIKKNMPSTTETALILYHAQAEKKFTLEEVFEKMMSDGALKYSTQAFIFISGACNGNKFADEPTPEEKKS